MPAPLISVIIPTHNRAPSLVRTLDSLLAQELSRDDFEVVVVANACTDETGDVAEAFIRRGLRLTRTDEPRLGLHYARHAGARVASAPLLAYIDDDIVVSPGWLSALLQAFSCQAADCAGGPIKAHFETAAPEWFQEFPGIYGHLDHGDTDRELAFPEDLYGGNLAIRRDLLFELGGFDPDAFGARWAGAGETRLLHKVYAAGKKVRYVAQAQVVHSIPAANVSLEYAIRRMRNHAVTASILACAGKITPSALRFRARRFALAAQYYKLKTGPGARIWQAYAAARSNFDRRLLREASLHPLVTRTDWIND